MAETTVFVDDAVVGRFPGVCVKHGDDTDDRVVLSRPIGTSSLGVLWLLLLAGPIGIIVLIVLSASRSRDDILTVRLPSCEAVTKQFNSARRSRWIAGVGAVVLSLTALVLASHGTTGLWPYVTGSLIVAAALAIARVISETLVYRRAAVGVRLDASRRWVTLSGVHPRFKAAVEADVAIRRAE